MTNENTIETKLKNEHSLRSDALVYNNIYCSCFDRLLDYWILQLVVYSFFVIQMLMCIKNAEIRKANSIALWKEGESDVVGVLHAFLDQTLENGP